MDEELKAAEDAVKASEGNESDDNTPQESQPEEETTGEIVEPAVATEDETVETEGEPPTGEPKKGAQARIKELNQQKKLAEEKAQSLEEKLAELTNPAIGTETQDVPQFNPQDPIVADDEQISVAELNKRIAERDQNLLKQANANSQLLQKQAEAINRINSEASSVVRKYPQLDPENESFDKELSDSITEATEAYVKSAPYSASVSKFVEKMMKPYQRAVDKGVSHASENIAKQVSQGALRPTSVRKEEKAAKDKTLEELEQELGIVQA